MNLTIARPMHGLAQGDQSAYRLDIRKAHDVHDPFGSLYVTSKTATLVWQGFVSSVDELIPGNRGGIVDCIADAVPIPREAVRVLVQAENSDEDDVAYELNIARQVLAFRRTFERALQDRRIFIFLRLDGQVDLKPYAVTVEYPMQSSPGSPTELTIQLDRSLQWTSRLLAWSVQHHATWYNAPDVFSTELMAQTINNIVRTGIDRGHYGDA